MGGVTVKVSLHFPSFLSDIRKAVTGTDGLNIVVEDGYGLSYEINDDSIRWCVTTKNNDAEKFGKALCNAAEELRGVMDRAAGAGKAGGEKAKL